MCVFVRVYIVSIFIRFGTAVKFYIGQVISGECIRDRWRVINVVIVVVLRYDYHFLYSCNATTP